MNAQQNRESWLNFSLFTAIFWFYNFFTWTIVIGDSFGRHMEAAEISVKHAVAFLLVASFFCSAIVLKLYGNCSEILLHNRQQSLYSL